MSRSSGLGGLQQQLCAFYDERDWRRFQTPKDLAASLAIEAAELQELFLWLDRDGQEDVLRERGVEVARELADVLINCLNLAWLAGIDLDAAVREKLAALAEKYPAEAVRGRVVVHERSGADRVAPR
jgi:NTP pyrophosphatase (non-canonical NTP hydrolase)